MLHEPSSNSGAVLSLKCDSFNSAKCRSSPKKESSQTAVVRRPVETSACSSSTKEAWSSCAASDPVVPDGPDRGAGAGPSVGSVIAGAALSRAGSTTAGSERSPAAPPGEGGPAGAVCAFITSRPLEEGTLPVGRMPCAMAGERTAAAMIARKHAESCRRLAGRTADRPRPFLCLAITIPVAV